ncbi:MAG TPA: serine hydrolase domain-containing protein [Herpetosiphonaceae bacterium]|nr:serine hydrolase domain-containing protein [Herpetosiphonaceae bacterium]
MDQDLQRRVQQLIDGLVESGEEVGLQVAAYVDGTLVVDAWAGVADEVTGRPVDGDTLFTSWSTTKGFVATCLHILADRGRVAYDAPVARYWPEFAANGKQAVTVRHALTHTAGIPYLPDGVTPEMMTDWEAMCSAIARHAPLWPPGTMPAYHAWTFGWIIGEIVRRVDGCPIAQFAQEELCRPLGIQDFYLGIPDAVEARIAPLHQDARHLARSAQLDDLGRRVMPPHVTSAAFVNRPDVRRASIPGGGGIMNARAIARHYAMLAGYGMLDGVRILSPERIDIIRASRGDWLGYMRGGRGGVLAMGRSGGAFGHSGNGGSLGFADPERKLSFGLTKNLMKAADDPAQETAYLVAETIRQHLDAV